MNKTLQTALWVLGVIVVAKWATRTFPPLAPLGRLL